MSGARIFSESDRIVVLSQLMAGFRRDETPDLAKVDELEEQLSPQEAQVCVDTLAVLRTRAHYANRSFVQSYKAMIEGLTKCPHSVALLAERTAWLAQTQAVLADQMHQDFMNPLNEILYHILLKEAAIHTGHQTQYLKYLVGSRRFAEAARLAVPLAVLYPAILSLRGIVEKIVEHAPHPVLSGYLVTPPARIGQEFEPPHPMTNETAHLMKEKFLALRRSIQERETLNLIEKHLVEIIGKWESTPLKSELKEFYYLQAIVEERKENYFAALMLFRSLVELDPCNLNYRNSMEAELGMLNENLVKQCERGAADVDLIALYPVLREIGHVSYPLLTEVCLAEVKQGLVPQAKEKMSHLVALNPWDTDYLNAAQKVAEAAQDEKWGSELLRLKKRIKEAHPWDPELEVA